LYEQVNSLVFLKASLDCSVSAYGQLPPLNLVVEFGILFDPMQCPSKTPTAAVMGSGNCSLTRRVDA